MLRVSTVATPRPCSVSHGRVCSHNRFTGANVQIMPAITIRDVTAATRDELASRAARKGQSLQQFLRGELEAMAERPDRAAVLERIRKRKDATGSQLSAKEILAELDADRR